ncbi:hypothetical protein HMPREF1139_1867 [Campylobacter sp. FOBRC14]|nr:hypothetical protein HMPREF1139_1867 [Campylobacter sp. FOBRC14]
MLINLHYFYNVERIISLFFRKNTCFMIRNRNFISLYRKFYVKI